MDARTVGTLEFDKVRRLLQQRVATVRGGELVGDLTPSTNPLEVEQRQQETSEARSLLDGGHSLSLGGVRDLRPAVQHALIGAALEPAALLDIAGTAAAGRRLKKALAALRERVPSLAAHALAIEHFTPLAEAIRGAIGDSGQVLDAASPALRSLRQKMRIFEARLRERLDQMVRSPTVQKFLQDPIVTVRQDRYVLPVKQEYRAQVPGIVHDQSASGQTLFIEPMAVVELNNDLKKLRLEEEQEVARILAELAAMVAADGEALLRTHEALGRIDLALAKGRLSLEMDAVRPELNRDGWLQICQGRHPLLGSDVVPVDIHLGRAFDTLVITGPNTGGKTVSLKTVGLFALMTQAGLHLPAAPGTAISVYDAVFSDIGDEQSIEQSLSTFSSHMTQIIGILSRLQGRSLVLLDEVGAGTDPAEGAALARAILEYLQAAGAKTVATTHYSELKTFAYTHPRVENAAVEFDSISLRPTYRLLIGLPGRSNAFEIAGRLGLDAAVVHRARQFLSREEEQVETLIAQVTAARQRLEEERRAAAEDRSRAAAMRRDAELLLRRATEREQQAAQRARARADEVLAQVRRAAETLLNELKESVAEQRRAERDRVLQQGRDELKRLQRLTDELTPAPPPADLGPPPVDLQAGEAVRIRSLGTEAQVLSPPDAQGHVMVQAGAMRVQVPLADLQRSDRPAAAPEPATGRSGASEALQQSQTATTEVDLRGLTQAEALERLDKFLDAAVLAGLGQVRIIHGKGTGALRRAVGQFLQEHAMVKSHRLGGPGEGGDGVSVAALAD